MIQYHILFHDSDVSSTNPCRLRDPMKSPAPTRPKIESPTGQRRKKNNSNTRNQPKDANSAGMGASPGGCFGFWLSNNGSCSGRSKTKSGSVADSKPSSPSSRSPTSATPTPPKENLGGDRLKGDKPKKYTTPFPCQRQKGRRSEPASVPTMVELVSGSRELGKHRNPNGSISAGENRRPTLSRFIDDVVVGRTELTPDNDMRKQKLTKEDDTPISPETRPPPVEASVSPEVQCGSFRLSKIKPASFFGSGRVASGVSDSRKLRRRGRALTVGDLQDSGISRGGLFDGFPGDDVVSNCSHRVTMDLMLDKAVEETSTTSTRKDYGMPLPMEDSLSLETQCGVRGRNSGSGDAKIFDRDEDGDNECVPAFPDNSKVSPVPSPAEAAMTLISSPRSEDGCDRKAGSGRLVDSLSTSSTLRGHDFSTEVCSNISDTSSGSTTSSKTSVDTCTTNSVSSIGPSGVPGVQGSAEAPLDGWANCSPLSSPRPCALRKAIVPPKERMHGYNPARESSPFFMDSSTNKNVMQTRRSVSTPDRHFFGPPWIDVDEHGRSWFESELDLLAQVFQKTSIWTSQSQISSRDLARVSWREGLVSRIFDLDEMDSFRCFLDEEESTGSCNNDQVTSHPSPDDLIPDIRNHPALGSDFQSPKIVDDDSARDMEGKEKLASQRHSSCSYVESICSEGGSLSSWGESDWNLCYRNQLYVL